MLTFGAALASAFAAALLLWSLAGGGGPPMAPAFERQAAQALARAPPALDLAETASLNTLTQSPASASAWVRLGYIESARSGRLTPLAIQRLERSYQVSPLGPDVSYVRLTLLFDHWPQCPDGLRRAALAELKALHGRNAHLAWALTGQVRTPAGKLALRLSLTELEALAQEVPETVGGARS